MSNPAKPIEQKKLEGTYRADRANANPLTFEKMDYVPDPPEWFTSEMVSLWEVLAGQLKDSGILEVTDLHMLETYVTLTYQIRRAGNIISKQGTYKKGKPTSHFQTYTRLLPEWRYLSGLLGFGPSNRQKIIMPQGTKNEEANNPFVKLQKQVGA